MPPCLSDYDIRCRIGAWLIPQACRVRVIGPADCPRVGLHGMGRRARHKATARPIDAQRLSLGAGRPGFFGGLQVPPLDINHARTATGGSAIVGRPVVRFIRVEHINATASAPFEARGRGRFFFEQDLPWTPSTKGGRGRAALVECARAMWCLAFVVVVQRWRESMIDQNFARPAGVRSKELRYDVRRE